MRSRESALWTWLRDGAPADAFLRRIEDRAQSGTPDVIGAWRKGSFMCELKSVAETRDGHVDCELRADQADCLRRFERAGGQAFVLVRVRPTSGAPVHFLIHAQDCIDLVNDTVDFNWLMEHCMLHKSRLGLKPTPACFIGLMSGEYY